MTFLLAIEASQSDGTVYRMAVGWSFHSVASWFAVLTRLF
jgi:hypothetical protein